MLELMDALAEVVGEDRLAIRLSPFGLYNQAKGMQRMETWGHLCGELKRKLRLSYVHLLSQDMSRFRAWRRRIRVSYGF